MRNTEGADILAQRREGEGDKRFDRAHKGAAEAGQWKATYAGTTRSFSEIA